MAQGNMYTSLAVMAVFIVMMYIMLIRPQKKKDDEVATMRSNLQPGDEIVTIGGILGRVVKTKEETVVIEFGASKTKVEIKKWAVSAVEKKAAQPKKPDYAEQEQDDKKVKPKKLGKKSADVESLEEEAKALTEAVDAESNAVVEEVTETVSETVEETVNE